MNGTTSASSETLIQIVAVGPPEESLKALAILRRRHDPGLESILRRNGVPEVNLAEALDEVWDKVRQGKAAVRVAYLRRVAFTCAIDYRRSRDRERRALRNLDSQEPPSSPENVSVDEEAFRQDRARTETLQFLIPLLPRRPRQVLELMLAGQSDDETRRILSISTSNLSSARSRGIKILRIAVLIRRGLSDSEIASRLNSTESRVRQIRLRLKSL